MTEPSELPLADETVPSQPPSEPSSASAEATATPAVPQAARRKRRGCWLTGVVALGALAAVFLVWMATVTVFHWTQSTQFCTWCHVMDPEQSAYEVSPHARTDCGTCHVGPGVWPAVQAKLRSAHYLWSYPLGLYEKPIPSPITTLRPVEVVCEQCHWPEKFYEDRVVVIPEYASDEQNSLTQTVLSLKTGGGSSEFGLGRGIHWHIENPVYYIATDEKRQDIPYVRAEYNGVVTEYFDSESPYTRDELAAMEERKMDCVDCHNRASHNFRRPADAIDAAMATGNLPADLPEFKKVGTDVLERTFATEEEAAAAIAGVEEYYKNQHPDVYASRQADVQAAVAGLQSIFDRTQFPSMNLTWDVHKNNIGHKDFPGCFRCHDGNHLSTDNQAVRLECNICHAIPQVADPGEPLPPLIVEPAVEEPESHHSTTWLAEHRYKFDATCAQCHTVENPGGSDNSSFCSNSACHATEWKYAGLNAPTVRELSQPPEVPSSGVPNPVPHPIGPRTDCALCHNASGVKPAPENHASFTPEMCVSCHAPTLEEGAPESGTTGAPPAIPHPIDTRSECLNCHGATGVKPAPGSHAAFTQEMCTGCHQPPAAGSTPTVTPEAPDSGAGSPPGIPHSVEPGADCTTCHGPDGVKPAPETHASYSSDMCTGCHQPLMEEEGPSGEVTQQAPEIPHGLEQRDNCLACHDPAGNVRPAPENHVGRAVETCRSCHQAED